MSLLLASPLVCCLVLMRRLSKGTSPPARISPVAERSRCTGRRCVCAKAHLTAPGKSSSNLHTAPRTGLSGVAAMVVDNSYSSCYVPFRVPLTGESLGKANLDPKHGWAGDYITGWSRALTPARHSGGRVKTCLYDPTFYAPTFQRLGCRQPLTQ